GVSVFVAQPPWPWLVAYLVLLFGGAYYWRRRQTQPGEQPLPSFWEKAGPWILGTAALATVLWLVFPRFPWVPAGRLTLHLLDVGQGESLVAEFPDGRVLVLDGGGFYKNSLDVGGRVVGPFLWSRGINKIDWLGATHSDQDHVSGVESLLERFRVGHLLDREDGIGDPRLQRLRVRAEALGVPRLVLRPGEPLAIGEVRLRLLHPAPEYIAQLGDKVPKRAGNDLSWVLRLDYRDFSMLLTGDITRKVERWLVQSGAPLRVKVLKAAHHGSRTSSSAGFIRAAGAGDVLFSSGYMNYFRHPHPEVEARFLRSGARMWRTDRMGAIHITTDGVTHSIRGHPFLSRFD
ncbi:MAG: ComEC/Rec2 family competence protein, partial [Nitrospinaceae bacterium]